MAKVCHSAHDHGMGLFFALVDIFADQATATFMLVLYEHGRLEPRNKKIFINTEIRRITPQLRRAHTAPHLGPTVESMRTIAMFERGWGDSSSV